MKIYKIVTVVIVAVLLFGVVVADKSFDACDNLKGKQSEVPEWYYSFDLTYTKGKRTITETRCLPDCWIVGNPLQQCDPYICELCLYYAEFGFDCPDWCVLYD